MSTPVSILLPVYNASEFLAAALESILGQTHQHFELIAVDDHSEDDSFDILQRFACIDGRIVPSRSPLNCGLAATLNTALRIASNELVLRMDADDLMVPIRVERQIEFAQRHPELAVCTSYAYLIDRKNRVVAQSRPQIDLERGIRTQTPALFIEIIHPACIMRKSIIVSAGGYNDAYRFAEDRELWGRLVTAGHRLGVQGEFLLHQRIHGASLTGRRVREGELICRLIDENIVRRLNGKRELSFEEYQQDRSKSSRWAAFRRQCNEIGMVRYKQATRHYAERNWFGFATNALGAIALNPLRAGRMLQKIKFR